MRTFNDMLDKQLQDDEFRREYESIILERQTEAFAIKLSNVTDSYYGFVVAVLTYVKNKAARLEAVENFMDNNPSALSSDILEFISSQDDFYEDAAYARRLLTNG